MNMAEAAFENRRVSLSDLEQMCERIDASMLNLRKSANNPYDDRQAPRFSSTKLAELCGIDRARLNYLVRKGELPPGEVTAVGRARSFSLEEAQTWIRAMPEFEPKPDNVGASVITVAMLKGGSTKTTTTMSLAQGLTLLGRKVLVIDLDPQASLSLLCGIPVAKQIGDDDTVLRYIEDPEGTTLEEVVIPSYWHNIDVIPGHIGLFGAEFLIPGKLMEDSSFRFFDILRTGLEPLKSKYDYILIDTSPSLSYLTINALMAADSLVMPVVPESLDAMSSLTFWALLRDFADPIERHYKFIKTYDYVSILLAKVVNNKQGTEVVRMWLQSAYRDWVSPIEVPSGAAMSNSTVIFGTPFDVSPKEMDSKTRNRILEPMFEYCKWIDRINFYTWTNGRPKTEEVA